MEPGMLPTASARTTLRRTVPFLRCNRPAGILVKKLNSASEPTATIAGTLRPKISTGSRRTPPPTPVRPMRTPTTKPTRIFAASKGIAGSLNQFLASLNPHPSTSLRASFLAQRTREKWGTLYYFYYFPLLCSAIYSDEAFALQVQYNFLGGFLGGQFAGVEGHVRICGDFIRIGDSSEFL